MTAIRWPGKSTEESVVMKLDNYLLNSQHMSVCGNLTGKAMWFRNNLGFTRYNANELAKQIKFNRLHAQLGERTEYGQKYRQVIKILGANGKSQNIVFNWIENTDGIVRLIGIKGFPKRSSKND